MQRGIYMLEDATEQKKTSRNMHNHENYVDLSHQKHAQCRKTKEQGFKALFKNTAATNVAF